MANQDQLLSAIDAAFTEAPPLQIYTHVDHCEECAHIHHLLKNSTPRSIVAIEDTEPLWNALCLSGTQASLHFMPGLARLSLREGFLNDNLSSFIGCLDPDLISIFSKSQASSVLNWLRYLRERCEGNDLQTDKIKIIDRRIRRIERQMSNS